MEYHFDGFHPGDPAIAPRATDMARQNGANGLPDRVDVLIAGCGPAGLCLAAQLARHPSIATMIVDPKLGPIEKGQADGISVRSMEMFQAFGFAQHLKTEAQWINETTFWAPNPDAPDQIHRIGQVQDVAEGSSEMPHLLINQARIHDMFLGVMKNAPTRLEPDYGLKVVGLIRDDSQPDPIEVTLEHTDPARQGRRETLRAKYVVGCDGARSDVRRLMGAKLYGEAAHQAWGVMDILAHTDFPDIRMKCVIQSTLGGNLLVLPREGGALVRLYVALEALGEDERAADRGLDVDDIIDKARAILTPYSLDVAEVVWWSIYEIGQRLADRFDDSTAHQPPHIFIAGDACHTHSPKAGQGMNVSMGDGFNLGWKLISVLEGHSPQSLLDSYATERRETAKELIEFDQKWSRVMSERAKGSPPQKGKEPRMKTDFIRNLDYTGGLSVRYAPSSLIGDGTHADLATGFSIGARFHSAPVIRLADAQPMQLGHVIKTGPTWTLFAFADRDQSRLYQLCEALSTDPNSVLNSTHRDGGAPDVIDLRAILQTDFRQTELFDTHPALRPAKGRLGLMDYHKIFCADQRMGQNIFDLRGIDKTHGALVIVRPDQYIAQILPLDDADGVNRTLAPIFG